jgi:hypothetical protein
MKQTRNKKYSKKNKSRKHKKQTLLGRNWITPIEASNRTLQKTKSFDKARETLRKQSLINARKLFGAINPLE